MLENRAKLIYLGIGSNLGNRKQNIEKAKLSLIMNGIKVLETSSYYESLSWPNPKNPKFLNIVLKVTTLLKPLELMEECNNIEKDLGRKKSTKNSPRECDIDVIDYKNLKMNKNIVLPHPRMHTRNFVLLPLFEIEKNWFHPILKRNIRELLYSLPNSDIRSIKQI
tara:strand:- start:234 stop:731 length:498 start_codon:yes stop_codon:yes gene_type:complete